jgi:hypothetical protein
MANVILSQQVQGLIWREREKILANVIRLVGKLTDEVVGEMASVSDNGCQLVDTPAVPAENPQQALASVVEQVIDAKFADVLRDISYRIEVLKDVVSTAEGLPHKITSQHLNLAHHLLDGYTFTANSPSTGYVAWTDCHVVYQGTDYTISNSSTGSKYIYWLQATPSAFQVAATKPSLGASDCLVAVNEGGSPYVVLVPGKLRSGAYLLDATVGTNELGGGAVTSAKLAASAVAASHIVDGAVGSTKLADGAVIGSKVGAGAVATSKLNLAAHMLY